MGNLILHIKDKTWVYTGLNPIYYNVRSSTNVFATLVNRENGTETDIIDLVWCCDWEDKYHNVNTNVPNIPVEFRDIVTNITQNIEGSTVSKALIENIAWEAVYSLVCGFEDVV